jgi:hypothetical protein
VVPRSRQTPSLHDLRQSGNYLPTRQSRSRRRQACTPHVALPPVAGDGLGIGDKELCGSRRRQACTPHVGLPPVAGCRSLGLEGLKRNAQHLTRAASQDKEN